MKTPDAMRRAAELLRAEAEALRECHTLDGDWTGEDEVKAEYDEMLAVAAALSAPGGEAVVWADQIESEVMEVMNGQRKPGKLSVEPIVRLCACVRTGTTRNAALSSRPAGGEASKDAERSGQDDFDAWRQS